MAESPDITPNRLRSLPTWQLAQANARAHALLAEALARFGSRGHHYRLLAALGEFGPSSQADVGRAVALDRSDVALGLADLESRGLVLRTPDPRDRRRNVVALTPTGEQLLRELDVVMADVQEVFLAQLPTAERATLSRILRVLSAAPP